MYGVLNDLDLAVDADIQSVLSKQCMGTVRGLPISDSSSTPHTQLRLWLCNSDSAHTTPVMSMDCLLITSLVALA